MKQEVKVTIDSQELAGTHILEWTTTRKEITPAGAIGVANNTGIISLEVNGRPAVRLWIHEDASGYVVVDVIDAIASSAISTLGRVDVELFGLVPPRLGQKRVK